MRIFIGVLLCVAIGSAQTRVDYPTQLKNVPIFSDAGPVGSTLQSLCATAPTGILTITKNWTGLTNQSVPCTLLGGGGTIQPANGQKVSISQCPLVAPTSPFFDGSAGGTISIPISCTLTDYNFGILANGISDDTLAHNFAFKAGWISQSDASSGNSVLTLIAASGTSMVQPGQVVMTNNSFPANCRTSGGNCYSVVSYLCPGSQISNLSCILRAISGTPNASNYVLDAQGMIHMAISDTFDGNATAGCINAANPVMGGSPANTLTGRCTNRYVTASSTAKTGGGVILTNWNDSFGAENFIIDGSGAGYTYNMDAEGGGCNVNHIQSATGNAVGQAYFDCQGLHIKDSYFKSGLRSGVNSFNYWQIDGQTQVEADSVTGTVIDWRPISGGGGGWGLELENTYLAPSVLSSTGHIFQGQFQAGVRMHGGRINIGNAGGALFGTITTINAQIPTFEFWGTNFDFIPTFTNYGANNYYFICHNCWRLDTNVVFNADTRSSTLLPGGFATIGPLGGNSTTVECFTPTAFSASFNVCVDTSGKLYLNSQTGQATRFSINNVDVMDLSSGGITLGSGDVINNGGGYQPFSVRLSPSATLFASLPACSSSVGILNTLATVTDSSTQTWGATVTGTGTPTTPYTVIFCDGSNWTVFAK